MARFRWFSFYSVGIKEVDEQHKKLISIINRLFDAMQSGEGITVMTETLDKLVEYTKYHFGTEEALMTQYGYPGYADHKREHDELIKKTLELKSKNDKSEGVVTVDLLNFLTDWLTNHLNNTDKKYKEFFNSHGVN